MTRAAQMRAIERQTAPRRPRAQAPTLTRVAARGARASASGASRRHGRGVSQGARSKTRRMSSRAARSARIRSSGVSRHARWTRRCARREENVLAESAEQGSGHFARGNVLVGRASAEQGCARKSARCSRLVVLGEIYVLDQVGHDATVLELAEHLRDGLQRDKGVTQRTKHSGLGVEVE